MQSRQIAKEAPPRRRLQDRYNLAQALIACSTNMQQPLRVQAVLLCLWVYTMLHTEPVGIQHIEVLQGKAIQNM